MEGSNHRQTFKEARANNEKIVIVTQKAFGTMTGLAQSYMEIAAKEYGYKLIDVTMNPSTYMFNPCQQIIAKFQSIESLEPRMVVVKCTSCSYELRVSDSNVTWVCPRCKTQNDPSSRAGKLTNQEEAAQVIDGQTGKLQKELENEQKLEQVLRELTPERRVELWARGALPKALSKELKSAKDFGYDATSGRLKGISRQRISELNRLYYVSNFEVVFDKSNESPSTAEACARAYEKLNKREFLWLYGDDPAPNPRLKKPFAHTLDRLVQEDFEKHPELKEQVERETERVKSIVKRVEAIKAEYEAEAQAKKSRFSLNPFKRRT